MAMSSADLAESLAPVSMTIPATEHRVRLEAETAIVPGRPSPPAALTPNLALDADYLQSDFAAARLLLYAILLTANRAAARALLASLASPATATSHILLVSVALVTL